MRKLPVNLYNAFNVKEDIYVNAKFDQRGGFLQNYYAVKDHLQTQYDELTRYSYRMKQSEGSINPEDPGDTDEC